MPQLRKQVSDNCNIQNQPFSRVIHRPIPITASSIVLSPFELVTPRMPVRTEANPPETAPSGYWFHGNISREDTERLLKHHSQNGTFLIRFSISTHKYVLSVIYNQQLYHYPIEELSDGFYQVNGTNAKYLGIDLLVSEFRRANNCIVCSLGKPAPGLRPPPHITVYGVTNDLHHAVRKANLKGVRDLFTRVNSMGTTSLSDYVNEKSADSGATPLIEAAKTGSNDIVRLLLEHNASVNLRDCGGFTALHRACQKSFAHVAETLLRVGRANPQIKCPFSGNTALHEAAMLGHADCVNCLLRYHAAPWARNAEAEMPFELALRYGFADLAAALAGYKPAPAITTQNDWYHPSLSKSETDKIFSNCSTIKDGAFLIRRSSQSERKFVLVLYYQHQTLKYQIEVVDFSFHMDTKEAYFIDKGPLHLSLEHLVEHYSRFADGIPVRLHYAISPSGRITNVEQLVPQNLDNHGRELRKVESSISGGDAWALRTISSSLHGGRMGAPLSMSIAKGASRHGQKANQGKHHSTSSSGVSGMSNGGGGLLPVAAGLQLSASGTSCIGSTSGAGELRLIPSDAVILLYRLGEGEFGEVYRGRLHLDSGIVQEVAVKVLVQPSQRLDFLKEATIMMQLSHPHIVTIYGVCENKRLMMILELAELGSLLDYLLDYPEKCQLPELYNWSMQIASGMSFLESARFVHRDLACRNVLLSNHSCAKISDFGLSRAVGVESDYYKATQRGKWPVKWYAPESIYYKTFSHASDVWSFGICLWEMFSLGEHPYADQDSFEVLRQIEEGIRLPRPHLANDDVFAIMHDCWAYNPDARPTFAQLLAVFQHLATNVYENVEPPDVGVGLTAASNPNPCKVVKNGIVSHNSNNNIPQSAPVTTTTTAMVTSATTHNDNSHHISGNDRRPANCTNIRIPSLVNSNGSS
ncbi:Tyrosine-protein kinase HTK16 [Schistosoma japonicum]|uniref:Tyrosine-protein kinase n=1 Tax=Schistosoma japonicum TaxID=6182 RepID=A0A4Z2CR88_SCHJA|nr:Tyrosine-protein kinase HTK16 [Schistosoma japonicum]